MSVPTQEAWSLDTQGAIARKLTLIKKVEVMILIIPARSIVSFQSRVIMVTVPQSASKI